MYIDCKVNAKEVYKNVIAYYYDIFYYYYYYHKVPTKCTAPVQYFKMNIYNHTIHPTY